MVLTYTERVVPPVGVAEVGLEVVGGAPYDNVRGRHEGADHEEHGEDRDYHTKPLEQVQVCDLDSLRRTHPEDHRYPENTQQI